MSDSDLPIYSNATDRYEDMKHVIHSPSPRSVSSGAPQLGGSDDTTTYFKEKPRPVANGSKGLPSQDRPRFLLLVLLYFIQGIPIGLAFGSVPFLLKSGSLSYSQVGVFTLAAYPYSMKLFWSPIVDSVFWKKIGRRRSWILPVQAISGVCLLIMGSSIDSLMTSESSLASNLSELTAWFFLLIFFCATQDIAVDGWALTILSKGALSYASTAQTVGINIGYFLSFTVFLAFNSPDFANKYLRSSPSDDAVISLGQYMTLSGIFYLVITVVIALFVPEDPPFVDEKSGDSSSIELQAMGREKDQSSSHTVYNSTQVIDSPSEVYRRMYSVTKLPNVRTFILLLLVCKIAFQANEGATDLKLLDKGFSREDLAITVLIDFPFEIIFGYYVARWSSGLQPLKPWLYGYIGRIIAAILGQILVYCFPKSGEISSVYFFCVICQHLLSSFMSTIQFVSISAFHTNIADPAIGGTYMTTLNTLSNLGGQWPKIIVLFLIDKFSEARCIGEEGNPFIAEEYYNCYSGDMKKLCLANGGVCKMEKDGYYVTNMLCIVLGLVLYYGWIRKTAMRLQSLPVREWRVVKSALPI
ncbi:DEKNAAC103975 [Brettanomyces naardenensis]|uniref:DEKNAAC103975 n=1 Tax=Brettanomyces naardenensis TaxID=13370 RepID=A0A448YPM9_BRENA|nr:DEKNAAC103975 [Brettanomyces naardenensis]